MTEISLDRIRWFTIVVGAAGGFAAYLTFGTSDALGFLAGAGFSLVTLRSWIGLTEGLGSRPTRSVRASAVFLILRYLLIGAALYVIVKYLGIKPVAMILGLLASFAAVVLELLYQSVASK